MSWHKRKGLGQKAMYNFCRIVCGKTPAQGESLLDLVARGLVKVGVERPITGKLKSAKKFVEANADIVLLHAGKAPKVSKSRRQEKAEKFLASAKAPTLTSVAVDVKSDGFLDTYAWRVVRMKVLIRDGRRCACCGATPATGAVMNVDHIKPRRLYPELALDENNLQVLCHECNHGKGNWDETDWRSPPDGPGTPSLQ